MKSRISRFGPGVVIATLFAVGAPASAQTLFFDNFDAEVITQSAASLINWNVSSGTVDIIGPGFADFYPGNGRYLDMDGSTSNAARIETKTVFDLTPGDYTLSFDQGKNNIFEESMNISVGSVFTTLFSSPAGGVPALVNREFDFTVGAATTGTIVFDHQGGDNFGIVVENVRLVRNSAVTVPESSTLALVLPMIGAITMAVVRRRKK